MTSKHTNTLFFDLGNVLIFFSLDRMFNQLSLCTKIPINHLYQGFMNEDQIYKKYETGLLSSQQLYTWLKTKSSHPFSFQEMMRAMADMFTPNVELWPIVEKAKQLGSKLVLLSNIDECHFQFAYTHYPILKIFDKFILSYEVGARKPEPLIFQKAMLESSGKNFYTDDIPAFVEAGRRAGLDAEVFIDVPTLEQHLEDRGII